MAGDIEQRRQELTRAELEIMQILWSLGKGFVNDVLAVMPEPKPAYNTVSTIIRILEKKGFVAHNSYGKSHEYYPLVDKDSYTGCFMNSGLNNFFILFSNNLTNHTPRYFGVTPFGMHPCRHMNNNSFA